MKINDIKTKKDLLESYANKQTMLVESVTRGMTKQQKRVVENIVIEFRPLLEAVLTADQIGQVFANAEKSLTAGGGNRTMVGKGVDVASKANEVINNIGKWLQNTTPVQGFDAKFEQLKTSVSQKFPAVAQQLTSLGDLAKANPGKTAAIIGVLTALASLAGGPVGGAIAGQVLKGSVELLKGEKLSTAVGKGMKAAAVGWLAGASLSAIGDVLGQGAQMVADQIYGNTYHLDLTFTARGIGYPSTYQHVDVMGSQVDVEALNAKWEQATAAWENENWQAAEAAFNEAAAMAENMNSDEYLNQLAIDEAGRDKILGAGQDAVKMMQGLAVAAQGAATGATGAQQQPAQESINYKYIDKYQTAKLIRLNEAIGRPTTYIILTNEGVQKIFEYVVTEGPMWDKVKGAAAKAGSAIAGKVAQTGKNLTTKVTADKLNTAWKKAKSPTDDVSVAKIMRQAGVDNDTIVSAFNSIGVAPPGPMAQHSDAPANTPTGRMAAQLGGGATSTSTGGTETPTATGIKHTASPNNPNQPQAAPAAAAPKQPAAAANPMGQMATQLGNKPATAPAQQPAQQQPAAAKPAPTSFTGTPQPAVPGAVVPKPAKKKAVPNFGAQQPTAKKTTMTMK